MRPSRPGIADAAPVVFFAGLDWWYHNRAHADFQLATRMALGRRVLLVNSIGTRMPRPGRTTGTAGRLVRKLRSIARGVRTPVPELPDFHVYSPLSLPAYGSRWGRRFTEVLVRWQVRAVLWWLRMDRPVVVVTPPTAWPVAAGLPHRRVLVNRSDKHSAWSEVDQVHMRSLERDMLTGADVVLYVAHALMEEESDLVGERSYFLDHGVDSRWSAGGAVVPPGLAELPRPRVGYVGTLRNHTVDLELMRRVAVEVPECALVVVGPVFMELDGLDELPNVHLVGAVPHEEVPDWCAGLDVGLMPWLDNDWIRACNPIKMKEYLAGGLRTVTTDFPEARRYRSVLDIAGTPDEFVDLVGRACRDPRPQDGSARRAAVAGDTWERRTTELAALVDGRPPAAQP